jgi:predicted nucleotidyltransferase
MTRRSLTPICTRFHIAALYAFGSRAAEVAAWMRGEIIGGLEGGGSDLDIGVLPVSGAPLRARARVELMLELEDFFGVGRVDLVVLPEAPPFLASMVIQGERLYALDADDADEYDLYVLRRAGDLLPFHRERVRMVLGGGGD